MSWNKKGAGRSSQPLFYVPRTNRLTPLTFSVGRCDFDAEDLIAHIAADDTALSVLQDHLHLALGLVCQDFRIPLVVSFLRGIVNEFPGVATVRCVVKFYVIDPFHGGIRLPIYRPRIPGEEFLSAIG